MHIIEVICSYPVLVVGVLGMLAGVLACTVESISYYPTVAQMCAAPPPPLHAINRGIGTEGLGTVLAGLWGSGNGTNTFGENVGAIGVTKVRLITYVSTLVKSVSVQNVRMYILYLLRERVQLQNISVLLFFCSLLDSFSNACLPSSIECIITVAKHHYYNITQVSVL